VVARLGVFPSWGWAVATRVVTVNDVLDGYVGLDLALWGFRSLIPAGGDALYLTDHGNYPGEGRGKVSGSRDRVLRRL
jgi:hypothetical protein